MILIYKVLFYYFIDYQKDILTKKFKYHERKSETHFR